MISHLAHSSREVESYSILQHHMQSHFSHPAGSEIIPSSQYDVMPLKVLTVGDGDLSFSLALKRAHSEIQTLVATTLLGSQEKLLNTYPHSTTILQELQSTHTTDSNISSVTVLYGVDATQLHRHSELMSFQKSSPFDLIMFQHPHLGYETLKAEDFKERHCQRHACLLAHYFYASKQLLSLHHPSKMDVNSCIHVCLSGSAADRWSLHDAAQRLHLDYAWSSPFPASRPILPPESDRLEKQSINDNHEDSNKRHPAKGRLCQSSKRRGHWLGKFGYRHQPTFPQTTTFQTKISDSLHYFLKPSSLETVSNDKLREHTRQCNICLQIFVDLDSLHAHHMAPAPPVDASTSS
jgi:hypothetical protein